MIFERKWFLDMLHEEIRGVIVILTDIKEETRKLKSREKNKIIKEIIIWSG